MLYTLASDSIAMHRFQISVFGAIAIVFAVQGVQIGIYTRTPSLDAMSAGYLILSIVDILWVLYFTSEEDSLMLHIFNSLGTGGLTPPSRRRRTTRTQSVHNMSANNGYVTNYASGIGSHDVPYDSKLGGPPIVAGGGTNRSQHSFGGSLEGGGATRSVGGGPGSVGGQPVGSAGSAGDGNLGPGSPLMGSGAAGVGAGGTGSPPTSNNAGAEQNTEIFSYKAKALYACKSPISSRRSILIAQSPSQIKQLLKILTKYPLRKANSLTFLTGRANGGKRKKLMEQQEVRVPPYLFPLPPRTDAFFLKSVAPSNYLQIV